MNQKTNDQKLDEFIKLATNNPGDGVNNMFAAGFSFESFEKTIKALPKADLRREKINTLLRAALG